jgi:hypothetical protein
MTRGLGSTRYRGGRMSEFEVDDQEDEESIEDAATSIEVQALYERLERRAAAAGIDADRDRGWGDGDWLRLGYKNGRAKRLVLYTADEAAILEGEKFEAIHFIGDYDAVVSTESGLIEARVQRLGGSNTASSHAWQLPGAEILDARRAESDEENETGPLRGYERPLDWRLAVEAGGVAAELSPGSRTMARVLGVDEDRFRKSDTLKLRGLETSTNEEGLKALHGLGASFLLDLDLRYGTALGLAQVRARTLRRAVKRPKTPIAFPANRYQSEPTALYNYGRSASGLPLLEYLAYYQAVEYYFTAFANAETLHRMHVKGH